MRRRVDETAASKQTGGKSEQKQTVKVTARSSWWLWVKRGLIVLFILYVATPFVVQFFPSVIQYLVYKHAVTYFVDLSHPSDLGLSHTVNMYLTPEAGVTVGVWSSWWLWVKRGLIAIFILYVATPFVLQFFPSVIQYLVYKHAVTYFVDLSRPSDLGLNHTVNMYLTPEAGVTVGVWHTVPEQKWKEAQGKSLAWYEQSLGDGSPVFIYFHGNTGNRATPHRLGVANVLSALGYHAVVMDYRGFGDSIGEPTEAGLTTDALYLYHWVRARSKGSLVIIWGHSLGTGVTTNTAVRLQEQGNPADAVILEGAFTSVKMPKGAPHPFTWYYRRFPYIQYYFSLDSMKANMYEMPNVENVKKMTTPLMILHSKDDNMSPFWMAEKLYNTAKSVLKSEEKVRLVAFDGSHGYRHNGLYRDPSLPDFIREFVQFVAK